MTREYFPSKFYLDNRTRYFLWSTTVGSEDDVDRDEVWTRGGIAPTFATLAQIEQFAREEVGVRFAQEGEPLLHDLDYVARWLKMSKQRRARRVEADALLTAWNIFSDLARSVKAPLSGHARTYNDVYMKLFWGNNLPSLTPEGQIFVPRWSGAQLQTLHDVMDEGLKLWRAHVR